MIKFFQYLDKKERDAKHQLKIVETILSKNNFKVKDYLNEDDFYIFVYNPKKNTFFEGIRIYKIGDQLAFKIQKEATTEPFSNAYPLNIEDMFIDLVSDYKPEEAGKKVIEAVVNEVNRFFEKSAKAENEIKEKQFEQDPFGKVQIRSSEFGVDYSNLTFGRAG